MSNTLKINAFETFRVNLLERLAVRNELFISSYDFRIILRQALQTIPVEYAADFTSATYHFANKAEMNGNYVKEFAVHNIKFSSFGVLLEKWENAEKIEKIQGLVEKIVEITPDSDILTLARALKNLVESRLQTV